MLIYVYDGSFEGLLTAIYVAYFRRERPEQVLANQNLAVNLFDQYVEIASDPGQSDKIYRAIQAKISDNAWQMVSIVFLTDSPDKGTLIYNYLRLGFRYGSQVDNHLHEACVLAMHAQNRKVSFEVHRFEGLLRFVKTEWGIYYARFEPDHNITMQLAPHFAARLSDQDWIIHDTRRGIAAMYNRREWILVELSPDALPVLADCEQTFQNIWKAYYQNISIAERRNPRLQKNMLPTRYWKNLTEMGHLLTPELPPVQSRNRRP